MLAVSCRVYPHVLTHTAKSIFMLDAFCEFVLWTELSRSYVLMLASSVIFVLRIKLFWEIGCNACCVMCDLYYAGSFL